MNVRGRIRVLLQAEVAPTLQEVIRVVASLDTLAMEKLALVYIYSIIFIIL